MRNSPFSTTVLKALLVLGCFTDDRQELGISEIASAIGMPVSSAHRLIQSLEYEGLLAQNQETKKYFLGSAFLLFSNKCTRYHDFERIAIRYVDQLGSLIGESINLSIYSSGQIYHIYTHPTQFVLRPNFPLNTPFPAGSTSVGRVFLSHMDPAAVRWYYDTHQESVGMPFQAFTEMLSRFRAQGYALDDEFFNAGLRCVGAPITLSDGTVLFAMSVSAPRSRMDDARYQQAAQWVVEYASYASGNIEMLK